MTREEAIKHLSEWMDEKMWRCFGAIDREAIGMAIEALQDDWIPCSERLPSDEYEHNPLVFVSTSWTSASGEVFNNVRISWYADEKKFAKAGWIDVPRSETVTAWKPLPQPYKGGEDE